VSPPNTFTPSRCALESRPFLELPKPFLCAMNHLYENVVHGHLGVILPVTNGALVLLLALEFENQNLIAAAMSGNRRFHASLRQALSRNQFVRILNHREDAAQLNFRPDLARKRIYIDPVAWRDPELLSASFNDC